MSIKIQFKGKIHLLSKELKTLQQIYQNIKQRYPQSFKYGIYLAIVTNNSLTEIKNDTQLQQIKKKTSGTVKLRVFQIQNIIIKKEEQNKQIVQTIASEIKKKQILVQKNQIEIVQPWVSVPKQIKMDNVQLTKTEILNQIPNQKQKIDKIKNRKDSQSSEISNKALCQNSNKRKSYKCYKCQGKGFIVKQNKNKGEKKQKQCGLCFGNKVINEYHPIMPILNQIVNDKILQVLKKYQIKPGKINQIEQKGNKAILVPKITKQYSFIFVKSPQNKIKTSQKQYHWKINIKNDGQQSWPKKVKIFRISPKPEEIFEIQGLLPKQTAEIILTFKNEVKNMIQVHEFLFGYVNEQNKRVFFGGKFGYELDSREQRRIQWNIKNLREMQFLQKIRQGSRFVKKQKHSPQFILQKLKQIGINQSIEFQLLINLIQDLQVIQL